MTHANRISILCNALLVLLVAHGAALGQQISERFTVSPGDSLKFEAKHGGDIQITTDNTDTVSIEIDGLNRSDVQIEQRDGTVFVINEGRGGWGDVSYELTVPVRFNVDASTGGGDIEVEGNLVGELMLSTHGGDVDFGDVDGPVQIQTHGGDIEGGEVSQAGEIKSFGGDIEIASVGGNLELTTHGGDVSVGSVGDWVKVRTMGGDIRVGPIAGDAELQTMGGDIELDDVAGSAVVKTAGGDVVLASANGEVEVATAGGDLELKNVSGALQAKTAGGDVYAELDPGETGSELKSAGGDVVLVLPSSARATVEASIHFGGGWFSGGADDYEIKSDFEGTIEREDHRVRGTFQINGGGPTITVATRNGQIEIRSRRQD